MFVTYLNKEFLAMTQKQPATNGDEIQKRLSFARFRSKMTSLSNDYQRCLYYRTFPRATAWPFHTSYSDTYCWKNLRASDIAGANTSNKLPRARANTKCIILYYHCSDETSEPERTPECAQCARHTKYSPYSISNMHIFEPIPKLMMPKQEPFHCPDEFPFPALGHTP